MLDNVAKNYRAYFEGVREARASLAERRAKAVKNYTGDRLAKEYDVTQAAYQAAIQELRDRYLPQLASEFEAAGSAIHLSLAQPVPERVLKVMDAYTGLELTDAERQTITDMVRDNYLAQRRAAQLLHVGEAPPSADKLLAQVEELKVYIDGTIRDDQPDSYGVRLIENGAWVGRVAEQVSGFCSAYSSQSEG